MSHIKDTALKVALGLPGRLPPRARSAVAWSLGRIAYHISAPTRESIRRAVIRTLSVEGRAIDRLAKNNLVHVAEIVLNVAGARRLAREWNRLIEWQGREILDGLASAGRGAILFTAHLGDFELLLRGLPLAGLPLHAVVWRQPESRINRLLDETRELYGTKLIYTQEITRASGLRRVLAILDSGGLILMAGDQYDLGRHVLPFFGLPTAIPVGPVYLAQMSGMPLLPIFIARAGRRHRITVEPPLALPRELDEGLALCVSLMERWIRAYPEQYLWIQRRATWGRARV